MRKKSKGELRAALAEIAELAVDYFAFGMEPPVSIAEKRLLQVKGLALEALQNPSIAEFQRLRRNLPDKQQ